MPYPVLKHFLFHCLSDLTSHVLLLSAVVLQYVRGRLPGDYVVTIYKKDQRMNNVTYTIRPYVAPPLPLPINPSIHSDLVTFRADPAVGPVYSREDVAVTLWNMRR